LMAFSLGSVRMCLIFSSSPVFTIMYQPAGFCLLIIVVSL
jgi:hypothetical protein